jgi:hypothetical protein
MAKRGKHGWQWGGRDVGRCGRYIVGTKQPKTKFSVISTHRTKKAAQTAARRHADALERAWARQGRHFSGFVVQVRLRDTGRLVQPQYKPAKSPGLMAGTTTNGNGGALRRLAARFRW